jgi:hypothetical protein
MQPEGIAEGPGGADRAAVAEVVRRINRAWLDGRPEDLRALFHPAVAMIFPGFAGRAEGRDTLVAGFADFCAQAKVHDYREADHQVDVVGGTAVASYTFAMVYERAGGRYHSTGRDLWVFGRHAGAWVAVWRTMLDVAEQPA